MALELSRRGFFAGLGASLIAAPAIVRAGSLMPVKVILDEPLMVFDNGWLGEVMMRAMIEEADKQRELMLAEIGMVPWPPIDRTPHDWWQTNLN